MWSNNFDISHAVRELLDAKKFPILLRYCGREVGWGRGGGKSERERADFLGMEKPGI